MNSQAGTSNKQGHDPQVIRFQVSDTNIESDPESESDADIIEIVLYHINDMGNYQKLLFIGMFPFGIFFAWVYFVQMFLVLTPKNYWCKVPELAGLSMELRRNLSAPGVTSGKWDSCKTFDTDWKQVLTTLMPPSRETPKVPCKNGWEFELEDIPFHTVVTERGWVCDRASYVPTAQSMFFAGSFAGCVLFGWMADRYGRVPAIMGSNLIGGVGGIATIFTTGVWDFIFCRFLVGMAFDNCFMILYILILEYVGPRYRTCFANMPIAMYYGLGAVALPWMAYFIADWRMLLCITSIPPFFALPAPWLMPESVRWLVSRGRVTDAVAVLRKFEYVNRTKVPDDVMEDFITSSIENSSKKAESLAAILKSQPLRIAGIIMLGVYGFTLAVYDALVRLSESFGLDFFIAFTIGAAIEIPSVLILTVALDTLGRRNVTWAPLFVSSIFTTIAMFMSKGIPMATFAVLSRFITNMCYTAIMQWGTEILPTPFRASGSAALHMAGFAMSLISPFIVFSERFWSPLPFLILTILTLIAAVGSLFLPETKGQDMPQTVMDAERIIKEQSLWKKKEVKDLKKVLSNVISATIVEPVQREYVDPVARSKLRLSSMGSVSRLPPIKETTTRGASGAQSGAKGTSEPETKTSGTKEPQTGASDASEPQASGTSDPEARANTTSEPQDGTSDPRNPQSGTSSTNDSSGQTDPNRQETERK